MIQNFNLIIEDPYVFRDSESILNTYISVLSISKRTRISASNSRVLVRKIGSILPSITFYMIGKILIKIFTYLKKVENKKIKIKK